jgi:uncharacterized protein YciI
MAVILEGYSKFVVDVDYVAAPEHIDAAMAAHIEFVTAHFAGTFLVSGPKTSGTGGIILATAAEAGQLNAILREDPFCKLGLDRFSMSEFGPAMRVVALQA